MTTWFDGAFEARAIFPLTPDRLYRVYLARDTAYFIRVGGQRVFGHGVPRPVTWLLKLADPWVPDLMVEIKRHVHRLGAGRDPIHTDELDALSPDQLLARHAHNFALPLDGLDDLTLTQANRLWLTGSHYGVLRFRDQTGFQWRLNLENETCFLCALGLLPRLLGARIALDATMRQCLINPTMRFLLGRGYETGHGLPQDWDEAVRWYLLAAESGHAGAQCRLAQLYQQGLAVPRDSRVAFNWCLRAVHQEHPPALTLMGHFCDQGDGTPRDPATAVAWYQKAADRHDLQAMYLLAGKYEQGQGILRDFHQARVWYQRAAERHHVPSQLALANLLYRGLGLPRDFAAAAIWFHQAAMHGNDEAKFHMGVMYEAGQGVHRNELIALRWYLLASEGGYAPAREAIDRLRDKGVTLIPARSTSRNHP